jgi:hypothetical protein
MNMDDCLTKYSVTIRVGHTQIEPSTDASKRITSAVDQHNQNIRIPGLDDQLNPGVLDPEKITAFLGNLHSLPEETMQQLQNKILYLNAPTLLLGTASPVTSEILKNGYSLVISHGNKGQLIQPTLNAPIDKTRARDIANRAREATTQFNQDVERLESQVAAIQNQTESEDLGVVLRELSQAKSKRFAAASVWRDSITALAKVEPENQSLLTEVQEAQEAAQKYISPPTTGMPAPG